MRKPTAGTCPWRRGGIGRRLAGAARLSRALLLLALLCPASASRALDPGRPLSQAQVDVWQVEDGLPQSTVTAILRSRSGHLWFGTYDGLVRFDGARFTVFDGRTTPLLAAGSTFALMEDRRGALWIGRSENVLVYENGAFRQVLGEELGQGTVWSLCEAPDGTVWGGAGKGLLRWKDGQVELFGRSQGLPVARFRSVRVDRDGTVWIGTNGAGLVSMRNGEVTVRSTKNGFPSDEIVSVLPDPSGGVWVSTAGAGLVRISGATQRVYGRRDGLPTDQLTALAFDPAGALWLGTWGHGICRFVPGAVSCLGAGPLSNDKVWSLLPDEEGLVWVGTWVGGLNRLRDRTFVTWGKPEGLSNENVRSVLHGRDGSVWLATAGGGLNRIRDGRVEVLRSSDGLPSDEVSALCEDRTGALWVGTYTSGLARIRGGRIGTFGQAEGLPGLDVRVVLEDRSGAIWVATTAGVARSRDGRRFEPLETPEWLGLNAVACMYEDREGAIWFGTSGDGLVRYDASGFRVMTTRDGLLSDRISSLHGDETGTLWIGTAWSGLNRLSRGRMAAIRPEDGLYEGRVQVILEDRSGAFWFTGNRGFQRLPKKEIVDFLERRTASLRPRAFGLADGLRSASFASGQQPAGSIGPDGRLWLPSYRGVVVVDPDRLPSPQVPPALRLEEVVVDGEPRAAARTVEVPPGRRTLELRYAPASLQPPAKFRFRFRLEGYDRDGHAADARRSAFYTGLPPGLYRFLAACRIGDGEWGPESELAVVSVRGTIPQTVWFRVLLILLALATLLAFDRLRSARFRRRAGELERVVQERTEELRRVREQLAGPQAAGEPAGIADRRRLEEALAEGWARSTGLGKPVSLVLAEIDRPGAAAATSGDSTAGRRTPDVARVIFANARGPGDVAGRLGEERFAIFLPGMTLPDARLVAETAHEEIQALRIASPGPPGACTTASFGVASLLPVPGADPTRLLREAEAALERARAAGGDRVETAGSGESRALRGSGGPA